MSTATLSTKRRYINTTWDVWTYDVWGNARDGYEVNDRFNEGRDVPIRLRVETFNAGTPQAFDAAYPSNRQIKAVLGLTNDNQAIETDGDDLAIYISRKRDGYPIGELHCTSHASLSPIRGEE